MTVLNCSSFAGPCPEIWLSIPRYEGIYEASNYGRIRSLDRISEFTTGAGTVVSRMIKGKIRAHKDNGRGYRQVHMTDANGRIITTYVHRMVAMAFHPNPSNLPEVHHKDFCRWNNCADNLEWMSSAGNYRESLDAGSFHGMTNKNRGKKLTAEKALEIRRRYALGESCATIASDMGVCKPTVWLVAGRQIWIKSGEEKGANVEKRLQGNSYDDDGEILSIAQIARKYNKVSGTIAMKLSSGMSVKDAVDYKPNPRKMNDERLSKIVSLLPSHSNKDIANIHMDGLVSPELVSHIRCGRIYSKKTGINAGNRIMLRQPPKSGSRAANPPSPREHLLN